MNEKDLSRFWSKVNQNSGPDGCWIWTGLRHPFGYGRFGCNKQKMLAHRVSYELEYGKLSSDQCVCHRCDNPCCVNPKHLFAGSRSINAADRDSKGRTLKGSQVKNSKLSEQQVLDIRASTASITDLSREYNVGYANIWAIIKRKSWTHI